MTTPDPNVCPQCGGRKKPEFELCPNCNRERRDSRRGDRARRALELPSKCIFETFYVDETSIKPEVFVDAAKKAAEVFGSASMTRTSTRALFNMLKPMDRRMRIKPDLNVNEVNECFYKFLNVVDDKVRRKVMPNIFRDFVYSHKDVVKDNKKEFRGFVRYLTSILIYLPDKGRG